MSLERDAHTRLIQLGAIPADEFFSPSKAKDGYYTQRVKEVLKEPVATDLAGNPLPPEPRSDQPSYQELLDGVLSAIRRRNQDQEMLLKAELKNSFRVSDEQINAALFNRYTSSKVQAAQQRHDSVSLADVEALEYLLDGWIPKGDIALTYGPYGAGKTTLAVWKAYSYAKGQNLLDRAAPCQPGKVLFIATDSGAAPLKKAFLDLSLDPDSDPILQPGHPEQRIWIWAHQPEQGHAAWVCDIHGVIQLEEFIHRHGITYVVIDSAKSVSSAAGWSYTNNESVKALLKYLREGICQTTGACIEFLSHDGSEKGTHSGAKAWAEDPSMVYALSVATDPDGRPEGITVQFKKDRAAVVDPRRKLTYDLADGALQLKADVEVVGNCEEAILTVLWEAHQRGVKGLQTGAVIDEVGARFSRSRKTVENTLGRITGTGKGNKPTPVVRVRRGVVALSPREIQLRSLSPNRGVGEMGGGMSRTTAPQGIYAPPYGSGVWGETAEIDCSARDLRGLKGSGVSQTSHKAPSEPPETPRSGEGIGGEYNPGPDCDLRVSPPNEGTTPPLKAGDRVEVRDAWRNWSNNHVVVAGPDAEGLIEVRNLRTGRTHHARRSNVRHCTDDRQAA